MRKVAFWVSGTVALLIFIFASLPAAQVSGRIPSPDDRRYSLGTEIVGPPKSGMRMAIEGRLKWLGIDID